MWPTVAMKYVLIQTYLAILWTHWNTGFNSEIISNITENSTECYSLLSAKISCNMTLRCIVNLEMYCEPCDVLWTLRCIVNLGMYCEPWDVLWTLRCTVNLEMYCEPWDVLWTLRCILWTLRCTVNLEMYCEPWDVLWTLRCTVNLEMYCEPDFTAQIVTEWNFQSWTFY
jgi:hypothetical protein